MSGTVNPEMLILARDSRGMTQGELARTINVTQGKISKYESGLISVSETDLRRLSEVLEYPPEFFFQPGGTAGGSSGCLYHRKRQSMPVAELRKVQANIKVVHRQAARLLHNAEIEEDRFYRMDVDEYPGGPEEIARMVRSKWGLSPGPVISLVNAIERAGGIVVRFPFGTRKLDAISQWLPGLPPLFFVNQESPGDRMRFSLAHEVGHVIMHRNPNADQERQADRFAAEFLMPTKDISPQLKPMSVERAAALKPYWRVSMAAIIKRAFDLGKIGEAYYRKLFTQLNKFGYRMDEPMPVLVEEPTVLRDLIDVHLNDLKYSVEELCNLVLSNEREFRARFLPERQRLRLVN